MMKRVLMILWVKIRSSKKSCGLRRIWLTLRLLWITVWEFQLFSFLLQLDRFSFRALTKQKQRQMFVKLKLQDSSCWAHHLMLFTFYAFWLLFTERYSQVKLIYLVNSWESWRLYASLFTLLVFFLQLNI